MNREEGEEGEIRENFFSSDLPFLPFLPVQFAKRGPSATDGDRTAIANGNHGPSAGPDVVETVRELS
jgi:hypothetical protein